MGGRYSAQMGRALDQDPHDTFDLKRGIMTRFNLSQRSLFRLAAVHPDLVAVVKLAITRSSVDFMVVEGLRSVARQRKNVATGASKTMHSLHLPQASGFSHAVDLAPLVQDVIPWGEWERFAAVNAAMQASAAELGVPVEWGGDWKSFKDGPHFQIPRHWRGLE